MKFIPFIGLALFCSPVVLAIAAGIVSGRRQDRSHWFQFWALIAAPSVLLFAAFFQLAWFDTWAAQDRTIEKNIRRTSATLVQSTRDADLYAGGIRRPRFRFCPGEALKGGLKLGVPIAALGLLVRRVARRRRIEPGHCRKCGYNLLGAAHERCPECGEVLPPMARPMISTARPVRQPSSDRSITNTDAY